MARTSSDTPLGMPSASEMADKIFHISDPDANAEWSRGYDVFEKTQEDREASGYVDSMQHSSDMQVGATAFLKSIGEGVESFGEATGILPGHMEQTEAQADAEREPTLSERLLAKIDEGRKPQSKSVDLGDSGYEF